MRNLKRALSLALASVMLVGMMVVGTSAASFSDVDSDHNVEAISVLQALGVMNGYDDGGFHPEANVTRNQMAMIICALLGLDGNDFTGYRPFTDVPDWAAGAVAACEANGIVGGRGEGIYDGDAYVTGVEAAAMMLRALGYTEMPASANWETPVVAKAAEVKLFKDVGAVNGSTFLNRNAVAQVALNALKADVVNTDKEGDIIVEGIVTIPGKITYTKVEVNERGYTGNADNASHDYKYQQLCEKLYDDDLELVTVAAGDDFGRPAHKWTYENKDVVTVSDKADRTYVGEVTAEDLYDDLGMRTNAVAGKVDVVTDGTKVSTAVIREDDDTTKFGTDGQTVEAYLIKGATAADDKVILSIVSSYLGVVTDDSAKSGDKTGIRIDVSGVGSKFFETAGGYAEDDVVLLTMANGDVKEITGEPKTISGEVTRLGSDSAMTIDGTKYPQAAQFGTADGSVIKGVADGSLAVSSTYTLYLDANDCYLAAVEDEDNTSTSLVYVFDARKASVMDPDNNEVENQIMATIVEMDGTFRDVKIELASGETVGSIDSIVGAGGRVGNMIGTIVNLNYDEDDKEYTLTALGRGDDYDTEGLNASGFELKADDRNGKIGETAATTYYLNNKTVYLFVSEKDNGKIDKVEIFTGGVDASVAARTEGAIAFETNKRVGYVVIQDAYSASADDVIYITDKTAKGNVKDGKLFEGYIVGEDSEKQEIAIQTGATGTDVVDAAGFYSYSTVKSNGNLDKLTKQTGSAGYVVRKTIASLVDGDGAFAGDSSNADVYDFTKAVIVDLREDTDVYGEITSLSGLTRAFDRDYTITVSAYINGDDEVVGLFVTNVTAPVAAHVHAGITWTQTAAKAATCTVAGNPEYWTASGCTGTGACSLDGKHYDAEGSATASSGTEVTDIVIPATGHTYTWTGTGAAGETHTGTCGNCSAGTDGHEVTHTAAYADSTQGTKCTGASAGQTECTITFA